MRRRSKLWVALATCVSFAGLVAADEPVKPAVVAEQLLGEWKQIVTRQKADDTLLVITFRRNGICRLDALDRASRELPQGPDVRLPGVGTWKLDNQDLVITWENWSSAYQRPLEQVDRFQIEKVTETELVYRFTIPGSLPVTAKWVRFEGWWLAKLLLGVAKPNDAADDGGE